MYTVFCCNSLNNVFQNVRGSSLREVQLVLIPSRHFCSAQKSCWQKVSPFPRAFFLPSFLSPSFDHSSPTRQDVTGKPEDRREASATVCCACRYTDVARGKSFTKHTNALEKANFSARNVCGLVNPCSWVISEGGLRCAESSNGGFGQANKPPKQKVFRFSRHEVER